MVDYSRFDKIRVEDDEPVRSRPRVTRLEGPSTITLGEPPAPGVEPARNAGHAAGVRQVGPQCARGITDYARWNAIAQGLSDEESGSDDGANGVDNAPYDGESGPRKAAGPAHVAVEKAPAADEAPPRPSAALTLRGGRTREYLWSQTHEDVTVYFMVPAGTRAKQVSLHVSRDRLQLRLAGLDTAVDRQLAYPIREHEDADDYDWGLVDSPEYPEGRLLRVCMTKDSPTGVAVWWDRAFVGDDAVDVSTFDGRDVAKAAKFSQTWQEAHERFRERIKSRERVSVDEL